VYEFTRTGKVDCCLQALAGMRCRLEVASADGPGVAAKPPAPLQSLPPNAIPTVEHILAIHRRFLSPAQPAWVGVRRHTWPLIDETTLEPIYRPPEDRWVNGLLVELAGWAHDWARGLHPEFEAPVAAALVHVRLAGIHPFYQANGRTARTLAALAMLRGGYARSEFTTLDRWWTSHHAEYLSAFRCLGRRWDPRRDVTAFVEDHLWAQWRHAAGCLSRRLVEQRLLQMLRDLLAGTGLEPRAAPALRAALDGMGVSNRWYRAQLGISVATATNDLAALERAGWLTAHGAGRSRVYRQGPRLLPALAGRDEMPSLSGVETVDRGGPVPPQTLNTLIAAVHERLQDEGLLPDLARLSDL